ncbi:hypothetical protein Ahia01_000663400 [Argonauta hians]
MANKDDVRVVAEAKSSDLVETLKDTFDNLNNESIGVIVALVVGLISLLLLFVCLRSRSKRSGVILAGICDAGKTLIFTQLIHKSFRETYTSIKSNTGSFTTPKKKRTLQIYDLPGHERLRSQAFEGYASATRAIVFVIDSTTYQKSIKDVAEYLYTLMCNALTLRITPFLILCNKQDQTFAKGAKVIKAALEKELNVVRTTHSAALGGSNQSSSENNNTYLGKRNKDFEFTDVHSLKVEFAECTALSKDDVDVDLEKLIDWLDRHT